MDQWPPKRASAPWYPLWWLSNLCRSTMLGDTAPSPSTPIHHVKGHQDKKKDQPLSIQEQLNIDCDKCIQLASTSEWYQPISASTAHCRISAPLPWHLHSNTKDAAHPPWCSKPTELLCILNQQIPRDYIPSHQYPLENSLIHVKEVQVGKMPHTL